MPTAAPRPCRHPGCGDLVKDGSGYCVPHRKAKQSTQDKERGSSAKRGYGHRWQLAREAYLREHPLCECEECRGKLVGRLASQVVDHIKPHKLRDALKSGNHERIAQAQSLFWNRNNWMAMNKHCHDKKTAREDGGFGR